MLKGIGHIALTVRKIEEVVAALCGALGIPLPPIRDLPERKVKVALVEVGNLQLEILEDTSAEGFIARHTAAHGNAIHHFCLLSDDLDADLEGLERKGVPLMDRRPRMGVRGKRIAFISPDLLNGIPIELSEP
ncbi:MAG: VOC family protein [Desulfobacterales bacterium]|jgi:methylmalonyl-CoA epimerase|nr:VOC family protein [Desulfobacterales bacterium]